MAPLDTCKCTNRGRNPMVVIAKGLKLNHLERPKVHDHQIEMLREFLKKKLFFQENFVKLKPSNIILTRKPSLLANHVTLKFRSTATSREPMDKTV